MVSGGDNLGVGRCAWAVGWKSVKSDCYHYTTTDVKIHLSNKKLKKEQV